MRDDQSVQRSPPAALAGGTHHAHRDRGAGYCLFNDVAVAARRMRADRACDRILIVDLDVHQGDGTASIFAQDASVFTLSLHAAKNFPFRKAHSDLDVELPDGTDDEKYLDVLDRLGRLKLSTQGLALRDARVFACARRLAVPIAVVMAGGDGRDIDVTVDVHSNTVLAAYQHWRSCAASADALAIIAAARE